MAAELVPEAEADFLDGDIRGRTRPSSSSDGVKSTFTRRCCSAYFLVAGVEYLTKNTIGISGIIGIASKKNAHLRDT
jgi:hypothetical protein